MIDALRKMRQGLLRHPVHREDVRLERADQLFGGKLLDSVEGGLRAGVEHENVHSSELPDGLAHHLAAGRLPAQVARKQDDAPLVRFDVVAQRLGVRLLRGEVVDRHIGPFARKGDGDGPADARIAARDERPAPFQAAQTAVTLLARIGTGCHLLFDARCGLPLFRKFPGEIGVHRILQVLFFHDFTYIVVT